MMWLICFSEIEILWISLIETEKESGKEAKRDINISVRVSEQNTSQSFACMCETHFDKCR